MTGELGLLAVSALGATARPNGLRWSPIRRGDTETLRTVFAAHGRAAFSVAMAITGERAVAEDAVTSAFMALTVERTTSRRSMRIEVLDATRLAAVDHADVVRPHPAVDRGWQSLYDGLSTDQLNVLALAIPGESSCLEIAQVLGMNRDAVHHTLRDALDVAARAMAAASTVGSGTRSSELG